MDNTTITTSLTVIGTLAAAFIGGIFKESYLRFRDKVGLAGAIAGELAAHGERYPSLKEMLPNLIQRAKSEALPKLPKFEKPNDRVFESCVGQIGLLGADLAQDVAYVYNGLNAFRLSMAAAFSEDAPPQLRSAHFKSAKDVLDLASSRSEVLLPKLKACAQQRYTTWLFKNVTLLLIGLLILLAAAFMAGALYSKSGTTADVTKDCKCNAPAPAKVSDYAAAQQPTHQQSPSLSSQNSVFHQN